MKTVEQLVREAMAERLIELEDIELILAEKRYQRREQQETT